MLYFSKRNKHERTGHRSNSGRPFDRLVPVLRLLSTALIVIGMGGSAAWGLHRSQTQRYREPAFQQPTRFKFLDAPRGMAEYILPDLEALSDTPWIDEQICRRVWTRLAQNCWIREVRQVGKGEPGVIVIDAKYRLPIALVQDGEYFYLVDEYGTRLPGQYGYQPGWLVIQGTSRHPPPPGEPWLGKDLLAGIELARMILQQPYRDQVTAVVLHNYGGRQDPYSAHIELATDRDGGRILWGSAPGSELEENSADQKLHILAENYRRNGRIDAGHKKIDISVFPDRFLIPS